MPLFFTTKKDLLQTIRFLHRCHFLYVIFKKENLYHICSRRLFEKEICSMNNIFENIQINIPFKSKYLIYGNSGNGKSTLIKILLKYLNDYK